MSSNATCVPRTTDRSLGEVTTRRSAHQLGQRLAARSVGRQPWIRLADAGDKNDVLRGDTACRPKRPSQAFGPSGQPRFFRELYLAFAVMGERERRQDGLHCQAKSLCCQPKALDAATYDHQLLRFSWLASVLRRPAYLQICAREVMSMTWCRSDAPERRWLRATAGRLRVCSIAD